MVSPKKIPIWSDSLPAHVKTSLFVVRFRRTITSMQSNAQLQGVWAENLNRKILEVALREFFAVRDELRVCTRT